MKEYLLGDGEKNTQIAIAIQEDMLRATNSYQELVRNNKEVNKYNYINVDKLGVFSVILKDTPVLAYDHPEIIAQFPNGIFTENACFIPASLYEKIGGLENEKEYFYKSENLSPLAFMKYLTEMIGHRFNKNFSDEEFSTIVAKTFKDVFDFTLEAGINSYNQVSDNVKPEFISNKNLAQICEQLNISSASLINSWGTDTSVVDQALLKSDLIDDTHPFSQFKSLINPVKPEAVNTNVSVEEFQEIYGVGFSPINVPKAFAIFETINANLIKSSPDLTTYVSKMNDKIIPFLIYLTDKDFTRGVNIIKDSVLCGSTKYDDERILEKITTTICNYTNDTTNGITIRQRDILIDNITHHSQIMYDRFKPFNNTKSKVLENQQDHTLAPKSMKYKN